MERNAETWMAKTGESKVAVQPCAALLAGALERGWLALFKTSLSTGGMSFSVLGGA